MTDLILHHFAISPFSEKLRLILGWKALAWRSVLVPAILPKPDVVALTGGYRRTPFLQIGGDIYCDSALAARVIDNLHSAPALYPAAQPLAVPLSQWADSALFWSAVIWAGQPAGAAVLFNNDVEVMKAFAIDRAPFIGNMKRPTLADATVLLKAQCAALDAQLAAAGPYLLGAAPSIADFSAAHPLWFVRRAQQAHVLAPYNALNAWLDRMLAIGHGTPKAMESAEALAIASAGGHAACAVEPGLGFEAGQPVTVAAVDYGTDPVAGALVGLTAEQVTLERSDPRAGIVHVHFPRHGFQIKKDKPQ